MDVITMSQPDKQPSQSPPTLSAVVFAAEVSLGPQRAKVWRANGPIKATARLTQYGVRFEREGAPAVTVPYGNILSVEHDG